MQTWTCVLALLAVGIVVCVSAGDEKKESCWDLSAVTPEEKKELMDKKKAAWKKCFGEKKVEEWKEMDAETKKEKKMCMGQELGMMTADNKINGDKIAEMFKKYGNKNFYDELIKAHNECMETPEVTEYMKCCKTKKETLSCSMKPPCKEAEAEPEVA